MKEVITAKIKQNKEISQGVYHLELELPCSYTNSLPGQFVNLYLNNKAKLLPRPLSILNHKNQHNPSNQKLELMYAVTGEGTKELSKYKVGTYIKVSTPLGNGFEIPTLHSLHSNNDIVLIGGGMGIAPMYYLARTIHMKYEGSSKDSVDDISKKPKVYAILGYSKEPFFADEFNKYCDEVQVCSEEAQDDCWLGNVTVPLKECEYYLKKNWFACGPHKMLSALSHYAKSVDVSNIQVSMEERMGCGFGTCVGCSINIEDLDNKKTIRKKVCKDGPVFLGSEVIW